MNASIRHGHNIDGKDTWMWPTVDQGCWDWMFLEKDLPDHILPYVQNKNCCITAGAHAGMYAYKYANIFNKVFAFEPHPVNFYCLNYNVPQQNVIKLQSCLSSHRKMVGLKTLHEGNSGGYFVTDGDIAMTMKIDDVPIAPDLIHLDVEGHDFEALYGGYYYLTNHNPIVVIETIPNYDTQKAENFLKTLNYKIVAKLKNDTIYAK